ncbi:hypothetical protein F8M41_015834 [Gigaspora margarita]|uniref:Uncharacterized protein n=1 Tax=Gigaspora margarita TaxID=4874 RepID=A0A8H3WXG0_GIGMA|nr:hypothetical protein F8M41_015834 [Gigaspora margarita]
MPAQSKYFETFSYLEVSEIARKKACELLRTKKDDIEDLKNMWSQRDQRNILGTKRTTSPSRVVVRWLLFRQLCLKREKPPMKKVQPHRIGGWSYHTPQHVPKFT